jgi:twitching motility protein PilT
VDGAVSAPGGARFRYNIFRRQGETALALRRLEDRFRTLGELGLPASLYGLCDLRDGLVVISGPTGSGKSTTLATLLDRINRERTGHIVTIEDPLEYLHAPVQCVVNQRQVGLDAPCFNDALVDALRQDPDVILVGEVRDLDTIRTAIIAAETGHLVFTTLHAGDCVGAVERLVAVFPADEQEGIRRQLSLVLRAVAAQHLLAPARGAGSAARAPDVLPCVAVSEILMVTPAVANLIATGKSAQIYSAMEAGASLGMQTMEQDLARLWTSGRISETAAMALARNPAVVRDRAALARQPQTHDRRERGTR